MNFEDVILQPMSLAVLETIAAFPSSRSSIIAEKMGLTDRQVNAAITKSLVRHTFVYRMSKSTPLMNKKYNVIEITPRGQRYLEWRKKKEESK